MFGKPGIRLGFRDNRQDLHRLFGHIIEHASIVTDSKAVLRMRMPSQPLDATLAHFRRLMAQMLFQGVTHRGTHIRLEGLQILDRLRGEYDIISHSGYILARLAASAERPSDEEQLFWLTPAAASLRIAGTINPSLACPVVLPGGEPSSTVPRCARPGTTEEHMSHDSEESTLPKCLICSQRQEGQRYTFWAGEHMSTKTRRALLSSTTHITSKYRNMKRVGAFVCRGCARRIVSRASWLTITIALFFTVVCSAVALRFHTGSTIIQWGATAGAALAGLTAVAFIVMSLFPNVDSWTSEAIIRDKAAPLLKRKGKGDSFFTEREYDMLFTTKPADRPETAEDLLAGIEDDDQEERPRKRPKASAASTVMTRCPSCDKATPEAVRTCKWCGQPLP